MKIPLQISPTRLLGCAGLLVLGLAGPAAGGPLHDVFLEKFQVGTWPQAADVQIDSGYPADLLAPAVLDSSWVAGADGLLAGLADPDQSDLTPRLLRACRTDEEATAWASAARTALQDMVAGRQGAPETAFVGLERLVSSFGREVQQGDMAAAAEVAGLILEGAPRLGISPREHLIWELRRRLCLELSDAAKTAGDSLWPGMTDLGPFDSINAWALWSACRLDSGLPLLPRAGDREKLANYLSRLPEGRLTATDLYESDLAADWIAALGGVLLKSEELPAHFRKYPHPPAGFRQQGLWVRGQRRLRRGLAGSYEQLASRKDLARGWQMDVWRRASELRLLRGAWVEGLADLKQALKLAQDGAGTDSLRRRLREWTEQALVLALAQDDLRTAREVFKLGSDHFTGSAREAFTAETAHWQPRLVRGKKPLPPLPSDSVDRARVEIGAGQARELAASDLQTRERFLAAADRPLWELWREWGLALADPQQVTGKKRERARAYRDFLLAWDPKAPGESPVESVLRLVGARLGDRPWAEELLRATVAVDVGRRTNWRTTPLPSLVPDLLPQVRGSELDRHALLGFCLAIGDMRGILGLAYELPGRGLTRAEKRLFLYPLPADGAIRAAISNAESEPALLLAVARNESLFEPAVRSRAGALGWMQIMPFHYPHKGAVIGSGNWRVPAVSVARGDRLLTENRRRYHGDPYRAVAAYNAGPGAASRWDRQLGGDADRDIYLAWIGYPETRSYVEKVLIDRRIYHEIIGAENASGAATGARSATEQENDDGQRPDGIH